MLQYWYCGITVVVRLVVHQQEGNLRGREGEGEGISLYTVMLQYWYCGITVVVTLVVHQQEGESAGEGGGGGRDLPLHSDATVLVLWYYSGGTLVVHQQEGEFAKGEGRKCLSCQL